MRGPERRPIEGVEAVTAAILDEAALQRENPPSGDPIIAAMWSGLMHAYAKDSAVQDFLRSFAAKQPGIIVQEYTVAGSPISEANNFLRMLLQFDSTRHDPSHYPSTTLGWSRQIRNLAGDSTRSAAVEVVADHCHTMTTSGHRLAPVEGIRQLRGEESAGLLDAASSLGIGSRQMRMKERFPFSPAQLLLEDGSDDTEAMVGYARLLGAPAMPGTIVMADQIPPNSRLAWRIARASLRPLESMDSEFIGVWRQLLAAKLADVLFEQCDLTDRASMGAVREHCVANNVRLAFLGTVLNIVGQENVGTVIDNVLWALPDHPDSEVIIAELAQIDRRKPYGLSLMPRWGLASYDYFGIRKHEPEEIEHLFSFTNGRARVGSVKSGRITVEGRKRPLRELLVGQAAGAAVVSQETDPQASRTTA